MLLDNPETIWLIKSGSLALFAINVQHGVPKGKRRYLFSVKAGEAMFSAMLTSPSGQQQILAIALEETELLQLSKNEFCNSIKQEKSFINQIERWVNHLSLTVSEITSPTLPTPTKAPGCAVLASNEVFQPPHDIVVWVKVFQGQANLLGLDELELTSDIVRIPLLGDLWLQARDILEIDSVNADILDAISLLNGLNCLQTLVLQAIGQLEQKAIKVELGRLKQREQLNNQAIANTLDNFAHIFDTEKANSPLKQPLNNEEALLFAAGAVARVLGITINPPGNSQDLRRFRDPLEAIARASRIRIRRITLRDKWWHQDSGWLTISSQH